MNEEIKKPEQKPEQKTAPQNQQVTNNNEDKNKKMRLGIAVLAVILVVFLALGFRSTRDEEVVEEPVTEESNLGAAIAPATPTTKNLSYSEAITAYEGRRVFFNDSCEGTPETMTVPVNTQILFDNASSTTKTIAFRDRTLKLRPYHYSFAKLRTAGTFTFTCDGNEEAATVVVE